MVVVAVVDVVTGVVVVAVVDVVTGVVVLVVLVGYVTAEARAKGTANRARIDGWCIAEA